MDGGVWQATVHGVCKESDMIEQLSLHFHIHMDFPGRSVVKNLAASAREKGLIPGLRRFHILWGN